MSSVRSARTGWITPTTICGADALRSVNASIPAVVLARAAAGIDVELLPKAADFPFHVSIFHFGPRAETHPQAREVHVRDKQPAQVGRVGDAAAVRRDR